jgi:hypothetical protein
MDWITQLLDQTSEYEAPKQYYFWSGLAAISAAVKDNVWVERGSDKFKTYPNIYVLLLAKTGVTRKSHAPSLIEQIVSEAKVTRVVSGRSSIEKILDDLGTAATIEYEDKSRKIIKDSAGFIVSGELSAGFVSNAQTLTILTNLYDRNYNVGPWSVNLKSGVKKLNKPVVTFLAATNDQHMKDFFQAKDMYGGFLARTIVISADAPKLLNPLLRPSDKSPDIKGLSCYLKELSKLTGPFAITEDVMAHFEVWYRNYYEPVMKGEADVDDKTGTFSRIGDHVIKTSMLLSLSRGMNLNIEMDDMKEAIALCEPFVEISQRAVRGIGKSTLAAQTHNVMEYMEQKGGRATRLSILQRFQGDIDHADLNTIEAHLEEARFWVVEVMGSGRVYQVPDDVMTRWKEFKAKRKGGDK